MLSEDLGQTCRMYQKLFQSSIWGEEEKLQMIPFVIKKKPVSVYNELNSSDP